MTDRPILFSAPMVCALLEGRKTQTRRLAWRDCVLCNGTGWVYGQLCGKCGGKRPTIWQKAQPGDRLWVREAFGEEPERRITPRHGERSELFPAEMFYRADDPNLPGMRWRPSIHMPRWASRLTLVVTDVRRERVQEISEGDAAAEGAKPERSGLWSDGEPIQAFRTGFVRLWRGLHGDAGWFDDPEVVALTFTVHQCNIDNMREAA